MVRFLASGLKCIHMKTDIVHYTYFLHYVFFFCLFFFFLYFLVIRCKLSCYTDVWSVDDIASSLLRSISRLIKFTMFFFFFFFFNGTVLAINSTWCHFSDLWSVSVSSTNLSSVLSTTILQY